MHKASNLACKNLKIKASPYIKKSHHRIKKSIVLTNNKILLKTDKKAVKILLKYKIHHIKMPGLAKLKCQNWLKIKIMTFGYKRNFDYSKNSDFVFSELKINNKKKRL